MPHEDRTELKYRIALTMAQAVGPVIARKLIEKAGSAREVFAQKKEFLVKIEGIGPRLSLSLQDPALLEQAEKEITFLERHQISALFFEDPGYPERLKQCNDRPILLYVKGEQGLHCSRSLSVVGTRRATSYGRDVCRAIIQGLSTMVTDLVIVSGLAYGIDVIAHKAALEYGLPTLAVLGHGLSTIYPNTHRETARKIIRQGALVTDFHSGMGPERNNFLRRNRIIAGLADATLVVESAESGGALITADLANSYDRSILAVPGRANDLRSRGCNALIKDNLAAMVESADDVIKNLNWDEPDLPEEKRSSPVNNPLLKISPSPMEEIVLQLLKAFPGTGPEKIASDSSIPIHRMLALLMELELKGWISVEPGNRYYLKVPIG